LYVTALTTIGKRELRAYLQAIKARFRKRYRAAKQTILNMFLWDQHLLHTSTRFSCWIVNPITMLLQNVPAPIRKTKPRSWWSLW